ncbi:MAG: PadR family transcriptional regulator [Candidatus Hodarchaeota archaeon]
MLKSENIKSEEKNKKSLRRFESRLKQGFLRVIMLHLIKQGKASNGYQLMAEIKRHTDNKWTPGPNRIYPILQEFEKHGWIVVRDNPGYRKDGKSKKRQRKLIKMTDKGNIAADERIRATRDILLPWQHLISSMDDKEKQKHPS